MIPASEVRRTYELIGPFIRRTPILEAAPADFGLANDFRLFLKLELFQRSGSFKARGAAANLSLRDVPPAGVAAASGGNHGAAVADAAARRGLPATIFVPEIANPAKTERIASSGARLVIEGQRYADALQNCLEHCASTGALNIHAYDQRETILGQATLGLEIDEQLQASGQSADTILVAVGGGGLISGVSSWFGNAAGVVGVEPETACALNAALEAGAIVDVDVSGIAADSLGARCIGELNFAILRQNDVSAIKVRDEDIRAAQELLWRTHRIVAEPGGATSLAALIGGRFRPEPNSHVCAIICGGNTDVVHF
jgi:threonine dehydratase